MFATLLSLTFAASVLLCYAPRVSADLGVPTSWRDFSNNRSLSERISISQAGINLTLSYLDASTAEFPPIGFWQSANVYSAMANHDHFAQTSVYKTVVLDEMNTLYSLYPDADQFGYNDDAMWWATAAYYAYRAYGDEDMLNHAITTWNYVFPYQLTAAQAAAGSTPVKDYTVAGTCNGVTMAGGVFWRPTTDDTNVNSITTGLFLTLSSYLASATDDTATYLPPAIAAAQWIENQNLNSADLVLDTIQADSCDRSSASWLFTYNTGKFVEGLAVLADETGDSQWSTLMTSVVAAATKNAPWQGTDGIVTEAADDTSNSDGTGFKAIYIRGLNEAFVRSPQNWDLQVLIHSYIDVQYNALLDLASEDNAYAINWHGPATSYTGWGQLAALDVLVSAISANT